MPVKKVNRHLSPTSDEQELLRRLVDEWRGTTNSTQPVILEEQDGPQSPKRIYVVWDAWDGFERVRRSELIMDAFEQIFTPDDALNVTVAMGLTPNEASRFGLQWR